ncbi:WD40 repeat-like protein [Suillus decipiens]|nr:WD40 repeat-like protein [Suillus decipiens]
MSSPTIKTKEIAEIIPYKTMQGHTGVNGVVHLLSGRRIITCSTDGSLRLWDLKSGVQIGDDWRDGVGEVRVFTIALSPDGSTVASGSNDGALRLWDVKTGKVIVKWKGHNRCVDSVYWSADGDRVLSVSEDGAEEWDVKSGKTVGPIGTGQTWVDTIAYSPDSIKFATGGLEDGVNIWDAKTGELLTTLKHEHWIATLRGHENWVSAITCSQNDRLLVSASNDQTARLWNFDINLPDGPPLRHKERVACLALSPDGKVLVTGGDRDLYAWDIHAILKKAGLEGLLPTDTNINASQDEPGIEPTPAPQSVASHFWRLMPRDVTMSFGMSTNFHHGFLTAWKPMMIPLQRVIPVLILLRVHFSLALPCFSAAFDSITLKRQNFSNPQCF